MFKSQQYVSFVSSSPFNLDNRRAYQVWSEQKLANAPRSIDQLLVEIDDPGLLSASEIAAIKHCCKLTNMAVYQCNQSDTARPPDQQVIRQLGKQFGLVSLDKNIRADDDGISALHVATVEQQHEYIPYSNRPINWHTDGYYNSLDKKIRAMILHCVSPAATGGENAFVDHEILYMHLRDHNPDYIEALMQADAMTIPANIENGVELRPAQSGPVFSVDADSGELHMRYTARTRSIDWKDEPNVSAAVKFISDFLQSDSPFILRHRLSAGQGLICNNVLHNRSAFTDDDERARLIYRARYYERIGMNE